MTVGCPSNGRRASSISALPAPAAQTSAGETTCSLLPAVGCAAAQASPPHRTPIADLAIPLLTHTYCYSPATADKPVNPHTVVLPSACDWTGASSMALVCSVRGLTVILRLASLVRSPCAVRRPLALSTSSTTKRNKEMIVRGKDDSRDPPASWQYTRKCLYITSPKIWFLLMVGHLGLTPLST